jgi:hypothetical protein
MHLARWFVASPPRAIAAAGDRQPNRLVPPSPMRIASSNPTLLHRRFFQRLWSRFCLRPQAEVSRAATWAVLRRSSGSVSVVRRRACFQARKQASANRCWPLSGGAHETESPSRPAWCVGHALWDEDRRQDDSSEEVRSQRRALVCADRANARHPALDSTRRGRRHGLPMPEARWVASTPEQMPIAAPAAASLG